MNWLLGDFFFFFLLCVLVQKCRILERKQEWRSSRLGGDWVGIWIRRACHCDESLSPVLVDSLGMLSLGTCMMLKVLRKQTANCRSSWKIYSEVVKWDDGGEQRE